MVCNFMDEGFVVLVMGVKENNENWFQIDLQLVNEIWSVFYFGMFQQVVECVEWGVCIINDDWGIYLMIVYGVMISLVFFEKDLEVLVC